MPAENARHPRGAPEHDGECGFSLVELMIATVVMVVGLVGIMNSCIRLHALQRLDSEIALAYRACRQTLEELRTLPLGSLAAMDGEGFEVVGPDGSTPTLSAVDGDADGMPGEIKVELERAVAARSLYRIHAIACWMGPSGRHEIELSTLWGGAP